MTGKVVIELESVSKWFGDFHVLKDIDLTIHERERVVICGPSGSGKSTVIRCINRLEEHQEGRIVVDGQELDDDTKNVAAIRREVGMVFMDEGRIVESAPPERFFADPESDRTKRFLSQILSHWG